MYVPSFMMMFMVCESKWTIAEPKAAKLTMRTRYVLPEVMLMFKPLPSLTTRLSGIGGLNWVLDGVSIFRTLVRLSL